MMSFFIKQCGVLLATAILISAMGQSGISSQPSVQNKVVVVLSGGGARGLAQIGVLKALLDSGIVPSAVVGTSMGAIISSLYAAGYSPDSIDAIVHSFNWRDIFANSAPRKQQFVSQKEISGNYLYELRFKDPLHVVIPQSISEGQTFFINLAPKLAPAEYRAGFNFDSLFVPLRIIATDIVTGKEIIFSQGNMTSAIRASCSLPLVYSPLEQDSMLLMDGGLSANIPVEAAQKEFPHAYIVAVDVTSSLWEKKELTNPVRIVDQIVNIGLMREKRMEKVVANSLIVPDLAGLKNTDFSHIDTLIRRGYDAAALQIPSIKHDLDSMNVTNSINADSLLFPPIVFSGLSAPQIKQLDTQFAGKIIPKKRLLDSLGKTLQKQGYAFSRISIVRADTFGTNVMVHLGVIKGFSFVGNTITKAATIRAGIGLKIGDTLRSETIAKGIAALYATDLFKTVNLAFDTLGTLNVFLNEKEFWRARVGLRFDEFHLLEGYVEPAYVNLLGFDATASLLLQYGLSREKYALEINGNHIFSSSFANMAKVQMYISRERIVNRELTRAEDTTYVNYQVSLEEQTLGKAGILAVAGLQVGKSTMLDGGIRIEQFQLYQSKAFKNPFGDFKRGIQYLMARLTIDDLDKFPFPEKGQKHYISIGGAHDIVGATKSFVKVDGSFSQYYTIAKKHCFSPQIQFVWSSDSLPDVERVFIGGAMSEEKDKEIGVYNYLPFFGLRPRSLPGDAALLFRGQYRGTLQQGLYVLFSIDWGYAWTKEQLNTDFTGNAQSKTLNVWNDFVKNAPLGMGLGIAYESYIGPIRFSWGRLLRNNFPKNLNIVSENLFYLSIGHDF